MEIIKNKYMISQVSPRLLILFFKNIRKNKSLTKEKLITKLQKQNEIYKRDPVLLSELIETLCRFKIIALDVAGYEFTLTEDGGSLKQILLKREDLFYEIYHVVNYHAFEYNSCDLAYLPFKSYQVLCDKICQHKLDIGRKKMAEIIDNYIVNKYNVKGSFSEVCVTRGLAWLRQLSPSIFDANDRLIDRKPKYIEPLLLSINYLYSIKGIQYGDPVFLDKKVIEELSMSSFIAVQFIEESLAQIVLNYPHKLDLKYNISGPYILLKKEVSISDFK